MAESEQERAALEALATFRASGFGYYLEQATRPQTIGYALLDSPVALAAWMLDHDTDSYQKISRAFVDGQPAGNLTRDHVLDNISLYWLAGTGASAARSYWESGRAAAQAAAAGQAPPGVSLPVGFTTFPDEIFAAPPEVESAVSSASPVSRYACEGGPAMPSTPMTNPEQPDAALTGSSSAPSSGTSTSSVSPRRSLTRCPSGQSIAVA
jgi:hypothetical protein